MEIFPFFPSLLLNEPTKNVLTPTYWAELTSQHDSNIKKIHRDIKKKCRSNHITRYLMIL